MTQLLHIWSKEQALGIRLSYLSDFMQIVLISHTGKTSFSDNSGANFCLSMFTNIWHLITPLIFLKGFAITSEDASLLLNILPSPLFANIEISDLAPCRGKL